MAYSRYERDWTLRLACSLIVAGISVSFASHALAQIASDNSLSTNVNTPDNLNFTISNGDRVGNNLFHSFSEFSVPTGGSATFSNAPDIENVIGRITGQSPSNIDGVIRAGGNANLFLINPNGIIFSGNAALEIGGSFLASTASSIKFADGKQFSTTASHDKPLLTVSVPVGLQFGSTANPIQNRSIVGLEVPEGKTLALVGGDVILQGGILRGVGGRIELGSLSTNNQVGLNPTERGWELTYENVRNFQDIQLSQQALVDTSGADSGDIHLQGKRINLTEGAEIRSINQGEKQGGRLSLNASESLEMNSRTLLTTQTRGSGAAGNLSITTNRLSIRDGGQVLTSTRGRGKAGEITVDSSELVELTGTSDIIFSGLVSATSAEGDAGNLTINTSRLIVRDAGITTESSGRRVARRFIPATGRGGNLTINASDSVEITNNGFVLTSTSGSGGAGDLTISTASLIAQEGAVISAASASQFTDALGQIILATGQGGNLSINASESVKVIGSKLTTQTSGAGAAGDLRIATGSLIIGNGAEINVSSTGTGNAGNLEVTANSIRIENGGKLTATSKSGSGGGNINLQNLDLLTVSGGSEISTTAKGAGDGGNINIDTDNLVLAGRSNITARAVDGRGGNIRITTQGLFVSPDSTIDASSDRGINGIVEIRRPDVDPSAELVILPADVVDVSGLVAQGCSAGGVASGESSFAITGRGGLPPTPAEATRSESILVDLGVAEKPKVISQQSKAIPTPAESSNKVNPAPLVEATGWVVGSNGEVVLTASVTTDTLNIPWFSPNSCNGT
mgnify:CR=1 FL=1